MRSFSLIGSRSCGNSLQKAPNALKFTVQDETRPHGRSREHRLVGRLRERLRVGGVGRRYTRRRWFARVIL